MTEVVWLGAAESTRPGHGRGQGSEPEPARRRVPRAAGVRADRGRAPSRGARARPRQPSRAAAVFDLGGLFAARTRSGRCPLVGDRRGWRRALVRGPARDVPQRRGPGGDRASRRRLLRLGVQRARDRLSDARRLACRRDRDRDSRAGAGRCRQRRGGVQCQPRQQEPGRDRDQRELRPGREHRRGDGDARHVHRPQGGPPDHHSHDRGKAADDGSRPGGTREYETPALLRGRPSVTDEQIIELAELALQLETGLGMPVDIECAVQDGAVYLLQCRPITTLPAPSGADRGTAMTQTTVPQPIPLPADFPVVWERPEDAHGFWERETMHLPGQSTMLDDSFARRWIDDGFNAACEDFSMPVRNAYRRVNTYVYQSIAPVSHDPAQLEQLGRAAQERLGAVIGRQRELWDSESPARDQGAARPLARVRSRGRVRRGARRAPPRHDRLERACVAHPLPDRVPGDRLDEPVRRPLRRAARRRATATARSGCCRGRTTCRSSSTASSTRSRGGRSPPTRCGRCSRPPLPSRSSGSSADFDDGRAFLGELDAFLAEHGRRTSLYITVSAPSWIEDPTALITVLQDAVTQPERDHDAKLAELAAERERLTADARAAARRVPDGGARAVRVPARRGPAGLGHAGGSQLLDRHADRVRGPARRARAGTAARRERRRRRCRRRLPPASRGAGRPLRRPPRDRRRTQARARPLQRRRRHRPCSARSRLAPRPTTRSRVR